jgi:hypothetical protein
VTMLHGSPADAPFGYVEAARVIGARACYSSRPNPKPDEISRMIFWLLGAFRARIVVLMLFAITREGPGPKFHSIFLFAFCPVSLRELGPWPFFSQAKTSNVLVAMHFFALLLPVTLLPMWHRPRFCHWH